MVLHLTLDELSSALVDWSSKHQFNIQKINISYIPDTDDGPGEPDGIEIILREPKAEDFPR